METSVEVRGEATGTPAGELLGVPHGGKSFKLMSIDVHTVEGGKIVRSYHRGLVGRGEAAVGEVKPRRPRLEAQITPGCRFLPRQLVGLSSACRVLSLTFSLNGRILGTILSGSRPTSCGSASPQWRDIMAVKKRSPTITLKDLAANLAESHELSKKQTEAVLGDLVGLVTRHLKKGDRVRIGGLGILPVRKRAARVARNAATEEPPEIAGKTSDGITILRATAKPKHFTSREVRAAFAGVKKA